MPKRSLVVWPRIVRFAMRVEETGGVWSEDKPGAEAIGEPVWDHNVSLDVQNLQGSVIGSTLSDGVGQKAAILGDGENANGRRRASGS